MVSGGHGFLKVFDRELRLHPWGGQVRLIPYDDFQEGSGIGDKERFNLYLGHIRIAALGFIQYGRFMGVKLKAGDQPHQALLGRTVLQGMILVYDGRDDTARLAV